MRAVAILTAAGRGSRLGADGPKALVPLAGVPMVVRAAHGLLGSGVVDHVVVTAPVEALEAVRDALATARPPVVAEVVAGGASRQASVAAGLAHVAALPGAHPGLVVLVHDAARPQAPAELVRRVVAAVGSGRGAVVPGLPVTDTVKQVEPAVGGAARVRATPDRRTLRAVQTPQGFTLGVLERAHAAGAHRAGEEVTAATDDAALVEALGLDVWVVDGHEDAMKITTRRDLAVATALLASGGSR
ncbi:MAG TPA: 2-C-methyl-D-erythritol 4-phosphate cytidylyltransferase [Actinotalea sp.]|nr:2-C-methyl-D-erythritol 4-phosphate cytidylyltransferase [Actinotalea sp.]